jgi:hypothetical protein
MLDARYTDLDRRYRKALRWGLVLSVAVHALLFLVFNPAPLPVSPFSAAVELRSADQVPAPPEPVPEVEPEIQEPPETEAPEELSLPTVDLADALMAPSPGTLEAPGLETGDGLGDGGTEMEGRFRVLPPRPRGLILPPGDRPDEVRGKEVEVWVFVAADGQVVPDSTILNPPTGNRGFDRRLREHAAGWVFEAARKEGRAVAEWFRYTVIM